jgi:hypothetical protein
VSRAALLVLLAAAAACSHQAEANYKHCLKLRVGMTKDDMVKVMGAPEETIPYVEGKSLPYLKGRTAYEWSNPASMPGGDHVSVDESGKIESIRCSNSEITASVFVEPAAPAAPAASTAAAVAISTPVPAGDLDAAVAAFRKKDLQQVLLLAKPLAAAENSDAQLLLGLVYAAADDVGLQGDKGEAEKWFYRSSRNKNAVAAALYALFLKGGAPAATVARETAAAAMMGHPAAEGLQAQFLLSGFEDAVEQDASAGTDLLLKAARGGDALSQLRLGERYQDEVKDPIEAYRWTLLASKQPVAGKFDDPLKGMAYFWTDKDLSEARERLKKLEPLLKPAEIKEAQRRAAANQ